MAAMRAERLPTVEILACLWLCALLSIVVEALLWAVRARAKGDQQEAGGSSREAFQKIMVKMSWSQPRHS